MKQTHASGRCPHETELVRFSGLAAVDEWTRRQRRAVAKRAILAATAFGLLALMVAAVI